MSEALINRRYACSTDEELIALAVGEGYESLAYALSCRLDANLISDDTDEVKDLKLKTLLLESQVLSDQYLIEDLYEEQSNLEKRLAEKSCLLNNLTAYRTGFINITLNGLPVSCLQKELL